MKKLIALAVALIFLSVTGIAVAADITMSGDYFVRGTYQKNAEDTDGMQAINETGTQYFDHEFNLNAEWNIDDNTKIITQFEMRDEFWGNNDVKEGTTIKDSTSEMDDNIVVEKVYMWHKFVNGHELQIGLIPANPWGTMFGDTEDVEKYRIRYDIPTENYGKLIGIIQKDKEATNYNGTKATNKTESDDGDAYYLLYAGKLGNIDFLPAFKYTNNGNISTGLTGMVALKGDFGNLGFESEFIVADTDYESSATKDSRTYGAYLNVWHDAGPVKAGILGAYGSYDYAKDSTDNDDKIDTIAAQGFGGDFDGGGAKIMGYDGGFLGTDSLAAGRLVALYADYDINDKLRVGGYAGYARCGVDAKANDTNDIKKWDGAEAWELSADAAYKITDNLVYDVGAGVAQLKWGNSVADPDKAYKVYHRLTVNF